MRAGMHRHPAAIVLPVIIGDANLAPPLSRDEAVARRK